MSNTFMPGMLLGTQEYMPPGMPPKVEPTTMPDMLQTIRDEADMLERALAGYTHLTEVLRQSTEGLAAGDRAKGLPILQYKASADGVHAVEVRADLGKIDPRFIPHVLSPLANVHAGEMYEALIQINRCAATMLAQVQSAMGMNPNNQHETEEATEEAPEHHPSTQVTGSTPTPPVG